MGVLSSKPKPDAVALDSFRAYNAVKCIFHDKGVESGVGRDRCMGDKECAWHFTAKDIDGGICKQRKDKDKFAPCPDIRDEFKCKHLSNQCEWSTLVQGCHMRTDDN